MQTVAPLTLLPSLSQPARKVDGGRAVRPPATSGTNARAACWSARGVRSGGPGGRLRMALKLIKRSRGKATSGDASHGPRIPGSVAPPSELVGRRCRTDGIDGGPVVHANLPAVRR